MSSNRLIMGFIILFIGIPLSYAASPLIRPGKWEVKMQMQIAGMSDHMPPTTFTNCVTPEQARDPAKDIMESLQKAQKGGENCQLTKHEISNRTAHWTVECTGEQRIQSNGEIVFDNDVAYHGVIKSNMQGPQGTMTMTQTIAGRRVGECNP